MKRKTVQRIAAERGELYPSETARASCHWAEVARLRWQTVNWGIPVEPESEERLAATLLRAYQRVGDVLEGLVPEGRCNSVLRAAELVMASIVGPVRGPQAPAFGEPTTIKIEILDAMSSAEPMPEHVRRRLFAETIRLEGGQLEQPYDPPDPPADRPDAPTVAREAATLIAPTEAAPDLRGLTAPTPADPYRSLP